MQVDRWPKPSASAERRPTKGVKTGAIPSIKIGRRIVVPTAAVRRMLLLDAVSGRGDAG